MVDEVGMGQVEEDEEHEWSSTQVEKNLDLIFMMSDSLYGLKLFCLCS